MQTFLERRVNWVADVAETLMMYCAVCQMFDSKWNKTGSVFKGTLRFQNKLLVAETRAEKAAENHQYTKQFVQFMQKGLTNNWGTTTHDPALLAFYADLILQGFHEQAFLLRMVINFMSLKVKWYLTDNSTHVTGWRREERGEELSGEKTRAGTERVFILCNIWK